MNRFITAGSLALALAAVPAAAQTPPEAQFEEAYRAWDRGDYVPALEGFARLLEAPGGERLLERIALVTGELNHTTDVAPDGRGVQFSADGRWAAFETGTGAGTVTRLVDLRDGVRTAAELGGGRFVFSPAGDRGAYIVLRDTPERQAAVEEFNRLAQGQDRQAIFRQRDLLLYLEARTARVVVRDLASGRERRLDHDGLIPASLAWSADGRTLYAVAGRDGDASRSDIYAFVEGAAPAAITDGPGYRRSPMAVRGGTHLVHATSPRNPIPQPPATPLAQRASGDEERVVIRDLRTGATRAFDGSSPALSADGSTVVFLARAGAETLVRVARIAGGEPTTVARTSDPVAGPAISPDGATVAYQRMLREDWELFLAKSDGSGEARLTHEIQHDILPRFVTSDRLLAVKGEGRHRRSYLYDTRTLEQTRLFHNNTVRTIAPEYEWAASPDGTKVLIVAERDGDTVSPERGVYLMDLNRRVTREEVLERVRVNLAAERELRERGRAMYAPVADAVRQTVERVSKTRLYGYQSALFSFNSKFITQPGNRKAIAYLERTLRGWGYDVELQWFEPRPGVRSANVIATLPGTASPELVYVVGSHFDSVERGPGADDNTSGTSMLLETARVLRDSPLPATVKLVFFTGEEAGLLGSREFVRRALAEGLNVVGALNNDMMGYANDHRLDNTIRYSNPGIRDVQHAAAFLFTDLITYDAVYYKNTDAHALYDGWGDVVGGIGSYPVLANPHYHQTHDVLETINQDLMQETTKTNVATVMMLASSPSRLKGLEVARRNGPTAEIRWTPAPEAGVRSYEVVYGPAANPTQNRQAVSDARATLAGVEPGSVIAVRAVNDRGLAGWDWARVVVEP